MRLFYITEPMTYVQREKYGMNASFMAQEWQIVELDVNAGSAPLPADAVGCYVEYTVAEGIVLTTPYVELHK